MIRPEEIALIAIKNQLMNKKEALKLINILKYEKLTCELCRLPFGKHAKITTDHIFPTSKGGTERITNLQLTHRYCNLKKSDKI